MLRSLKPTDHRTEEKEFVIESDEVAPEAPVTDAENSRLSVVYEKLIELYRSRERNDWKSLIGLSTKWSELAEGVFER